MAPVVTVEELKGLLGKRDFLVVDAQAGSDALQQYGSRHISGAPHVNLDLDLAAKPANPANGGRHPLPDISMFAFVLGRLGIAPQTHVVVYDNKIGANAAARFWWMLRSAGHGKVQVLSGGLNAAISAGIPVDDEPVAIHSKPPYPATEWKLAIANIDEVKEASQSADQLIIDVRESYRYRGESEPFDLIAGHIPGAINLPFAGNVDEQGNFLAPEQLRQRYLNALENRNPEEVIVSCGSGVTACHTLLAMEYAGLPAAKLYVGSWSEWSRNDLPIAKDI